MQTANRNAALELEGYTAADEERWASEPPKSQSRTAFERDRARLIHSSALRRLGEKSQILIAGSDDFARTRLTHTLEVAQIGRQIATMLGCNPDVVDCACLAHDLGHPPFGHNGERVLARVAENIGGFEGNAQTLRLLTRLEPKIFHADGRSAGVNLTRASLDAAVKYPWSLSQAQASDPSKHGKAHLKFGVYPDDLPVFQWLKEGAPQSESKAAGELGALGSKPVECQVMDLADDIAYSVHDVEDAIVLGAFDPVTLTDTRVVDGIVRQARQWYGERWDEDELLRALQRLRADGMFPVRFNGSRKALAQLKNITSNLIGRFAWSVEEATRERYGADVPLTRYSASLVIPEQTEYEIVVLKGIAAYFVMEPREHEQILQDELHIVEDLIDAFMRFKPLPSPDLEPVFLTDWAQASNDDERLRVAVDQVASLTDTSAITLHNALRSAGVRRQ